MKKFSCSALLLCASFSSIQAQAAALGVFQEKVYTTDKLLVKFIDVQGGHIFPESWLKSVLAEYTGRELSPKDIAELQARLTRFYIQSGYATSGVVVPEQEVTDGVLVLQVVHGRVKLVEQSGGQEISPAYVQEYLRPNLTVPVNVQSLNQSLSMLQEHELVENVHAELLPGKQLGESTLRIELEEHHADYYQLSVDNYQSPSIGAARLGVRAGNSSLFGMRDRAEIGAGVSEGLKDYSVIYSVPLNLQDVSMNASLQGSEYSIVEEPFDKADLTSRSYRGDLSLVWPVVREFDHRAQLFFGIEQTSTRLSLLDVYSQRVKTASLLAGMRWQWRLNRQALALELKAEQGIEALGATSDASMPDGVYRLLGSQLSFLRQTSAKHALHWRLNAQWVNDAVPAVKRFTMGGVHSVRGYRQNRFVRDYGFNSSLEWHWKPAPRWTLFPFADYAQGWSAANDQFEQPSQQLYSAGLGMRWQHKGFDTNLVWGAPLVSVESVGDDLQDKGVYLSLNYRTR